MSHCIGNRLFSKSPFVYIEDITHILDSFLFFVGLVNHRSFCTFSTSLTGNLRIFFVGRTQDSLLYSTARFITATNPRTRSAKLFACIFYVPHEERASGSGRYDSELCVGCPAWLVLTAMEVLIRLWQPCGWCG